LIASAAVTSLSCQVSRQSVAMIGELLSVRVGE
jgi:hypothetical protein